MVFKMIYPLKFQHITILSTASTLNMHEAPMEISYLPKMPYIMLRFNHQIKLAVLFANYIIKYD